MGNIYQKVLTGTTDNQPIRIPTVSVSTFKRLKVKHGNGSALTFKIFNRRGAISGFADINVRSGQITGAVASSAGFVQINLAAPHGLQEVQDVVFQWSNDANLNGLKNLHPTLGVSIPDALIVEHTGTTANSGIWQQVPEELMVDPFGYELFSASVTTTIDSVTPFDCVISDNPTHTQLRGSNLWGGFFNGDNLVSGVEYTIMYVTEQPVFG